MAEPVGAALDAVITKAQAVLQDVTVVRRDERPARSLIDVEGRWGIYRIIISEIHVADGSVRYAYYLTVRANFREKIRIEISSWNERTHHHHPRANRRYSGHHRLSLEDACGRID